MGEHEKWDVLIRGQAVGVVRLFALGVMTPKQTVDECDRLLNHEAGCPEDVAETLRETRRKASRQLL